MSEDAFDALLAHVEAELAFATSHYNDSYLDRRITSRMRRTRTDDYGAYLDYLRETPDEGEELLEALSINVTGFFRNPDVWQGIRDLLQGLSRDHDRIHVWSAACADGREAYSMAMLAHDDPRIDESAVRVLGTDISRPALETAREGVYEDTRTVDIDEQLGFLDDYHQYVERAEGTYRVRQRIRRGVNFERHDLINDDPKSGFHLVVCRNLFIYIDNEYKRPVLETIGRSLRENGYLVIGKAETIPPARRSEFAVLDGRLRIYQHEASRSATTA